MVRNHSTPSRRTFLGGAALATLTVAAGAGSANAASSKATSAWPTEIPLPNGFLCEGITIGREPYAFMGSRANGAVYRADLRTGTGSVIYAGETGTVTNGLKLDHDGLLYLAGAAGGTARVVDSRTGSLVTTYQLTAPDQFINDVVLLGDRAWFTDSRAAVLYGVPRGGTGEVRVLPLSGDWVQTPNALNANGLVGTPDGRDLIVVSSGKLYRVALATGVATGIVLDGAADVSTGDGLVRIGRTLYVVQNRLNKVSVFTLDSAVTTATLSRTITDPRFDVPTTGAVFGNRLYLVNARFTSPQTPDTTFSANAVTL
ncbi:SMP-30/gluconolactonase/LRE family protein [Streptomyces sp. NPDC058274]|uniref:SMP-30/gluconolactonase/LRE family protein n=1 Tax=Streptomyces sp. NPDC058274 TaxID=3346416 RepID=UPI0036E2CDED